MCGLSKEEIQETIAFWQKKLAKLEPEVKNSEDGPGNRIIDKLSKYRFVVMYENLPDFKMVLDFWPIVKAFKPEGNFILAHWHGKPALPNTRHFAFFEMRENGETDYKVIEYSQMKESTLLRTLFLQVPDEDRGLPSAVIMYPNCIIMKDSDDMYQICDMDFKEAPKKQTKKRKKSVKADI